jgi:hypothetical protein
MKPVILALDISTHCGWAIWDTSRQFSSITCGVFEFPEKIPPEVMAGQLGRKVRSLIERYREQFAYMHEFVDEQGKKWRTKKYRKQIDFVVIETAKKTTLKGGWSTIVSSFIHGAVYSVLDNFGIPWGVIADSTWRKMHFGQGYKPPKKETRDRKTGQIKLGDPDWKGAAIKKCEDELIKLPALKATRDNAAEAALIGIVWRGAKILADEHLDRFTALLQQRNERPTAGGDLFGGAAA